MHILLYRITSYNVCYTKLLRRTQNFIANVHNGVDIGNNVSVNTSLYAIGDGTAKFIYAYKSIDGIIYNTSWGNHVELQTPGTGKARYAHLSAFANGYSVSPYTKNYSATASVSNSVYVPTGQKSVSRGEYIGKIGNTGQSAGVHLHFEYLVNNIRINPDEHVILPGGPSGTYPYVTYK